MKIQNLSTMMEIYLGPISNKVFMLNILIFWTSWLVRIKLRLLEFKKKPIYFKPNQHLKYCLQDLLKKPW